MKQPNLRIAQLSAFLCLALGFGVAGCAGESADTPEVEAVEAVVEAPVSLASIRDVTIDEASALISGEDPVVVLDVRTPEEFAAGHIEGAINVNVMGEDFVQQLADLDRDAAYVLHCKSGARSARALEVLKGEEFGDIAHMTDGFDGWVAAGQAVQQ